ncbi:MAG: hypothetical protein KA124_11750 [Luteimonas sp.]|nr:hypothetical protein [Luteimonas sp.]
MKILLAAPCILACCLSMSAVAQDAGDVQEAVNRDGSRLRLQTSWTPQAGEDEAQLAFVATLVRAGTDTVIPLLSPGAPDQGDEPTRSVRLVDVDGDGFHDLETTGDCGAGPNCSHTVFRFDSADDALYLFFDSGYFDAWVMDGHLVESGRASCCAWEFHAWPLEPGPRLTVSGTMAFMATVSIADDDAQASVSCRFSRPDADDEYRTILPPKEEWLALCEHYREPYHLVTPEEADRHQASADVEG